MAARERQMCFMLNVVQHGMSMMRLRVPRMRMWSARAGISPTPDAEQMLQLRVARTSASEQAVENRNRRELDAQQVADGLVDEQVGQPVEIGQFCVLGKRSLMRAGARVGRHCELGDDVELGERSVLMTGALIGDRTIIGAHTCVYPHAVIGFEPQDRKYGFGPTRTVIGSNVTVRERVCIERGTELGGGVTTVRDRVLIMANSYIGHDCEIEADSIVSGSVSIAGHVKVGPNAVIGGHSAIHQKVRIGEGAMIGAMSAIRRDVIPFTVVSGNVAQLHALNFRKLWPKLTFRDRRILLALFKYMFIRDHTLLESFLSGELDTRMSSAQCAPLGSSVALRASTSVRDRAVLVAKHDLVSKLLRRENVHRCGHYDMVRTPHDGDGVSMRNSFNIQSATPSQCMTTHEDRSAVSAAFLQYVTRTMVNFIVTGRSERGLYSS
ncbi:Acyl-acyl-carrier-protein--UDP-N-acetylglucosamine O-acyltransferase [Porphyridium purpureum]|uniref:Acyl-acyl-carrier-protein--UDP-N-acetylglucosamine O-acyltransferase n=1 Tax=Porphyridium purpureum TaxID=35688 RepID=A0A5J4Z7T5_PORPP|nr:Acyl-acyl-carrier-protein--UDP-N-acetylglucosamine O-acyltransferase [Porphyridium purpureum]|eukprot:POR7129..scf295_1